MFERLNKANEEAVAALQKKRSELDVLQNRLHNPPIARSIEEIRQQADIDRAQYLGLLHEIELRTQVTSTYNTFIVSYSEYANAYSEYSTSEKSSQEHEVNLNNALADFNNSLDQARSNPYVVDVLRASGFVDLFPLEEGETQPEEVSQKEKEELSIFQSLINDFVEAANNKTKLSKKELTKKYYPELDWKEARPIMSQHLKYVHEALRESGYRITNTLARNKPAIYEVEKLASRSLVSQIKDRLSGKENRQVTQSELIREFFSDITDKKKARRSLADFLKIVRKKFREEDKELVNLVSKVASAKGREPIYEIRKTKIHDQNKKDTRAISNKPVNIGRLHAFEYVTETTEPDIDKIIELLGPTSGEKTKPHPLTKYQAMTALERNFKKLIRRHEEGIITEEEQKVLVKLNNYVDKYINTYEISEFDFRRDILLSIFGPQPIEESQFDNDESKSDYLKKPVAGNSQFTNRDAIHMGHLLDLYKGVMGKFFGDCSLPDRTVIDKVDQIFPEGVMERDRTDTAKTADRKDKILISQRIQAISNFINWSSNNAAFNDEYMKIESEEILEIVYCLYDLSNKDQVKIDDENYTPLIFLNKYLIDKNFRKIVDES
jgi:hypothetical protein